MLVQTKSEHDHYNRVRAIIMNPNNNEMHISAIGNLVRSFESRFGLSKLSNSLNIIKLDMLNRIKLSK